MTHDIGFGVASSPARKALLGNSKNPGLGLADYWNSSGIGPEDAGDACWVGRVQRNFWVLANLFSMMSVQDLFGLAHHPVTLN